MMNHKRIRLTKLAFALSLALAGAPALAQNTTSAINGQVTDASGKPASGAQVTIVHAESGSVSSATTDAGGRYVARGLRPGGPYTITITKNGVTEKRENVFVNLAETANVDAQLGAPVATVTVTGQSVSDRFNKSAMGAGTGISRTELAALSSVNRNLQDYARIDPRVSQTDKDRGEMSVAGQNSRFNSITIDGVAINDTFGLEASGLPTAKQPISIDAIQSVQVNVSNYDVTQKGYTGANVNAVTKSGTNKLAGSVYYVFRDDRMVGDRYNAAADTYFPAPEFQETTKGATLGGPIIKDKLFFFGSYEVLNSTRSTPTFGPLGSNLTQVGITQSAIASANAIAAAQYPGLLVGSTEALAGAELEIKDAMAKIDWNINDNHRASLRVSKLDQTEPFFATNNSGSLALNSSWYTQKKTVDSTVVQVFSDWTENFSTEVKYSARKFDSEFINQQDRPAIGFQFTGALPPGSPSNVSTGSRFLNFGTERSRHFNVLNTETTDAYFGANWLRGDHEIKFGTDYTNNKVYNAFLQDTKGNYTFSCVNSTATYTYSFGAINCGTATAAQIEAAVLENFRIGRPSSFSVQVPNPGFTLQDAAARFTLKNHGFFAQDTWAVTPRLSFQYGLRVDVTKLPQRPPRNNNVGAAMVPGSVTVNAQGVATYVRNSGGFGYDNTSTIDGEKLWQPRLGFNYTLDSALPKQLRGGIGLFEGAAANVWLANPFQNAGVATRLVSCATNSNPCPSVGGTFSIDPTRQPTNFAGAQPAANVDILNPGLAQPSIWKANLAWEQTLPIGGLVFSMEYLRTDVKSGIYYRHLNLGAPTAIGKDGRELYYTQQAYNPACWTSSGGSVTNGACTGFRSRALSNPNFNNVLLATETGKGGGNIATVSIQRPLTKGFGWSFSYTYSDATEVSNLSSSTSASNFNSRAIFNPNENVARNSAYAVKDRFSGTLTWQKRFFGDYKTTIGAFYEGRKGKPYSWTYRNDLNGDNVSGNDLMYIPSAFGSGEVVFAGDTAANRANEQRFWDIVNANPSLARRKGSVVGRNDAYSPWTNSLDMRITQEIPGFFKGHKGVFALDLQNVGNMINKRWGRIDEIPFSSSGGQQRSFVAFGGLDAQGRYIYNVLNTVDPLVVRQAKGESQWAIQATARYEF